MTARGDVRLNVERVLLGVKTAGDVEREGLVGAAAKLGGYLTNRDSVLVDYAVEAFIFFRIRLEVLYRAEVVTDSEVSARLNSRI